MEKATLKIEYKKFNTFLLDFIKTINRGWLFMKMKHKYPIDTQVEFIVKVKDISFPVKLDGTVIFHGQNDEGKDGIGLKIQVEKEQNRSLLSLIEDMCKERFGSKWGTDIFALLEEEKENNE